MFTTSLLSVSRSYADFCNIDLRTVSSRVFDDGKVLPRIADGVGSVTLLRADRAIIWFSEHWPAGAEWPAGVERPPVLIRAGEVAPAAVFSGAEP